MNFLDAFVAGVIGTIALTTIIEASLWAGLSRMSLPYILGTMFTPDRRRAAFVGAGVHLLNGIFFAFAYASAFQAIGRANLWIGCLLGVVHTGFMLILVSVLPGVHPRMATDVDGPTAHPALQPPGFLLLNYGVSTPLISLLAHIIFGAIMGGIYTVA